MPKTSIDPGVWQLNFSPPAGGEEAQKRHLARQKKKIFETRGSALDSHDILWFKSVTNAKYWNLPSYVGRNHEPPIVSNLYTLQPATKESES
jgi:hypothetical protein